MKLPRDLSGGRVVAALQGMGFTRERQDGSHVRLSRGILRVTVSNHANLAPKTLQSILRQAGISHEQLREHIS